MSSQHRLYYAHSAKSPDGTNLPYDRWQALQLMFKHDRSAACGESGTPASGYGDYKISVHSDDLKGVSVEEYL